MIDPEVEWHANFAELSEDDLASLLETKVALNIFIEYLNEKQLDEATLVASKVDLSAVLQTFYAEARK